MGIRRMERIANGFFLALHISSESSFTQKSLITRPTSNGRITLTERTLKVMEKSKTVEQTTLRKEDYKQ